MTVLLVLGTVWLIVAVVSAAICWYRLTRPITAIDLACSQIDLALRARERRVQL